MVEPRAFKILHWLALWCPLFFSFSPPHTFSTVSPCFAMISHGRPSYLSVLACLRNEGPYLTEWIEYHLLVGVDHFWLMDNNSTDHPEVILSSYIALGIVNFRTCPGFGLQVPFYNHMLATVRNDSMSLKKNTLDLVGKAITDMLTD
jgi:hypothetical protein